MSLTLKSNIRDFREKIMKDINSKTFLHTNTKDALKVELYSNYNSKKKLLKLEEKIALYTSENKTKKAVQVEQKKLKRLPQKRSLARSKMILFNEPRDEQILLNTLAIQPFLKNSLEKDVQLYYFTGLTSLEDIRSRINGLYQTQTKTFKMSVSFGFVFEKVEETYKPEGTKFTVNEVKTVYVVFRPSHSEFLIQRTHITNKQSLDASLHSLTMERLEEYVNTVRPSSAHKIIGVYSMCVKLMKLDKNVGAKVELPDYITKNRTIINLESTNNMCFWFCIAYHTLKNKRCATLAKELFEKFYGVKPTKDYEGIDWFVELPLYEEKYNTGINVFEMCEENLEYLRKSVYEGDCINLLHYEGHFCYITKLKTLEKTAYRCQKCGHCFEDKAHLTTHIKYCQDFTKEDKFVKYPQIYEPDRNVIVEMNEMFGTNCDFRYNPIIVYDFEALVVKKQVGITDKFQITNEQQAVSVSLYSNIEGFEQEIFIENENPTILIEEMFNHLDKMTLKAVAIMKEQLAELYVKLFEVCYKNFEQGDKYLKKLSKYVSYVPILGFNSGKYDINLCIKEFMLELVKRHPAKDIFAIKNGNSYKSLKSGRFLFLDICQYLPPGYNLDTYVKAFNKDGLKKSIFPYEFLDSYEKLNYPIDCLTQKDFYSSLKNCGISDEEWEEFKTNKNLYEWKTIKDLLKFYNNLDVKPFLQSILNHRKFFYDLNLEMFKDGFSLPALAEKIMFSYEFKDFNESFIKETIPETPYKEFTNWTIKKHGYETQDKEGKRLNRKEFIPYDEVQELMHTQSNKCLYCWRTMDNTNWTLDRIDNDKGHNKGNCVLACKYCNTHRSDENFNKFYRKKALLRYSKTHNLIHLIDEKNKICFDKLKENIAGGASIVFHRYHEAGVTKIKRAVYEDKEWKLGEEGKEVKNITGFDANALYLWCIGNNMPCGVLEWIESEDTNLIHSTNGFTEVDIETPESLYNHMGEFPLIFKNTEYDLNQEVGATMLNIFNQFDDKQVRMTRKLISSFSGKKVLIKNERLRWLLQQGLVITKMYGYIKCQEGRPFESFMLKVSEERRKGDIDPDHSIIAEMWKLVGNSAFGRTGMNKNRFTKILYGNQKTYHKQIGSVLFKDANQYGDLYEITRDFKNTKQNMPIQIACSVYDDAKLLMSQFYYDCVDKFLDKKDFQYIEMDTDSAYMALTDDFDKLIKPSMLEIWEKEKHKWFMRTDTPENKAFDKRKPGLFKPEFIGKGIVALSSKMYYVKGFDSKDKFSCKGIQKKHNTDVVNFEKYKNIVLGIESKVNVTNRGMRILNAKQIGGEKTETQNGRTIYNYKTEKLGLCGKYDKRIVLDDLVSTAPLKI